MPENTLVINQLGYLPNGPKQATIICDTHEPISWVLRSKTEVVARGKAIPGGFDPTVGSLVQTIDFSDIAEPGDYVLQIDAAPESAAISPECEQREITVKGNLYDKALIDSLILFTLQRSGYEITPDIAGPEYARAAGHLDVAPNLGDCAVKPLPAGGATTAGGVDLYDGWTGDYTVNARGGWYDAGDAGKYVVNGGISVAQLLAIVERLVQVPDRTPAQRQALELALFEALWELGWMIQMSVADSLPLAGMVHHKVSDEHWTGIPTLPAADPQPRYVHRPSTAATLNLAATAAQASRVIRLVQTELSDQPQSFSESPHIRAFKNENPAFYKNVAKRAYEAAKSNPILLAPDTNVLPNPGSGPYNDTEIADEWYWAAIELYLATRGSAQPTENNNALNYLQDARSNPYHPANPLNAQHVKSPWSEVGFDWRDTAAWARLQLALHTNGETDADQVQNELVAQADNLIANQEQFGQLYSPANHHYAWGSNGMVANNAAIVAAAYDIAKDEKYRLGALAGLDYLFGRNALDISYVTGYGQRYVQNQHSRWFAHQVDPSLPHPPSGTLSGGPNSDCPDPASEHLRGKPAQYCYIDDIDSYGTNEMTINWNSALAGVLAFAAS
ncbi:MAG: glycoside hydrolase family 9 protein [Cellulomonadaceae bacterium]|jgi:endoglucanase|nr:glycoside hydrolase family 9 protein [Cellulomonadaceae bacterium]